ncbi:DUF4123 domain-containing protein [Pectobacterium parmentieri]|uniref:DUF4123 domain-containing protein n=1 Tax=Pectobacterium parmentieri TaxID=1905730 RepID=UPI000EB32162|nr:DUF4123 domain-containing protein [Pectobacterium parmentieri]AYH01038.1 hypothetical protein C5E26_08905 [Pectobacterium parmentieri]AYH27309.1 hypothetical protein C5E20_09310 [Pectobacterium parmentieri]AYH31615.1 hypothetical protein C5E19_08340 [Pectobacterium parmentieri]MBI0516737.1 DUF4123 domain-containing protein [Pectobacterium parmentieri]
MDLKLQQWLSQSAPGLRLYAVLSNVSNAQPLKYYYQLDGSHTAQGIYCNTAYKDWNEVMPYLVELSSNSPFLDWVSSTSSIDWGWLAMSDQPHQRVVDHLRGLTQVNLPNEKTVFFRYWDGQFLPLILAASTEQQQNMLMGVFNSLWIQHQSIVLPVQAAPLLTGIVTLEDTQLAKLRQQNQNKHVCKLHSYFIDKYPKRARALGTEQVGKFITLVSEKCQTYHLERFNDCTQYLDFACCLGSHFDTDPQLYDIIANHLISAAYEPGQLGILNQRLGQFFIQSMGEDLEIYLAVLGKLNKLQINQLPYFLEELEVVNYVRSLYPERAKYVPIYQMVTLLKQDRSWCQEHGINTLNGQAIILALQFFLGYKVFDDPLYPWVSLTHNDVYQSRENTHLAGLVAYAQRRIRKEVMMLQKHLEKR